MEAALRGMSICFLLNLLSPFRREEQPWLVTVTRSLAQHLLYIEANIEFSHLLTSNHYLSDVVGLYCLSIFLRRQGHGKEDAPITGGGSKLKWHGRYTKTVGITRLLPVTRHSSRSFSQLPCC